jgi:NAD(P)H-flavin reductase
MQSGPDTPLLFVAGGTGVAPILALLRQQARSNMHRNVALVWGAKDAQDLYALDEIVPLLEQLPSLRVVLARAQGELNVAHERVVLVKGTALDALIQDESLAVGRDIYAAGPAPMLRALGSQFDLWRLDRGRIHFDAFGV